VIWQLLQWFGAGYVSHVVRSASATNGVFALVLGLLAFLFLVSITLVLCAEINVVRAEGLHPRALLTMFTDDVDLTPADRETYTKQAKAEQVKTFERVDVSFNRAGDSPPNESPNTSKAVTDSCEVGARGLRHPRPGMIKLDGTLAARAWNNKCFVRR
jgi:hypothetical protein